MVGGAKPFQVGAWTVDPAALVLSAGEVTLHLRPKVMELLEAFAGRPGEVLSKRELLDLVWSEVTVGEASLTVAVRELREALGDRAEAPTYIETIARRGYRLIAPVSAPVPGRPPGPGSRSRFWLFGFDREYVLVEGENLIGRASDVRVRIPSTKVSRHHARIVVSGDAAVIEDLGSKNGTFVAGSRVEEPKPLANDDEIRLGQMAATLRVVVIGHESTVTEQSQEPGSG